MVWPITGVTTGVIGPFGAKVQRYGRKIAKKTARVKRV
jgi:hypothetical protein